MTGKEELYLDKILHFLKQGTKKVFRGEGDVSVKVPYLDGGYYMRQHILYSARSNYSFSEYVKYNFGLSEGDVKKLWGQYWEFVESTE